MIGPHVQRKDWINIAGAAIAIGLVVNLAALTLAVIFVELKPANENILMFLAGGLLTQVTNIVQWFFGSSSENKKQNETISTLAATAQTAQAALAPVLPPSDVVQLEPGQAAQAPPATDDRPLP